MKQISVIVIICFLLLGYCGRKQEEDKIIDTKNESIASYQKALGFYSKYPLNTIPYQIIRTEYLLEVKILSINRSILKNAYQISKDVYTVEGYRDGMELNVNYSIKNTYNFEIWIPIPTA